MFIPGEFAAFADRNSERRRDQVYDANQAAIEAAYRARFPADDAGGNPRASGLKSTPLGKLEHQAAWSPSGELGQWAIGNPAVVKIGGTLFVHGGISAAYATIPIDDINGASPRR